MSFIISTSIACVVGFLIIYTKKYHQHITSDNITGVQKVHSERTPRIGGIVLGFGLIGGSAIQIYLGKLDYLLPLGIGISLFPIFFMGMIEDLTKCISAECRFITAIISGLTFYIFLHVGITQTGFNWLDMHVLTIPLASLLLTTFIIAGISNATNLIDGFNGLLLGFSLMASSAIAYISYLVGDNQIFIMSSVLLGAIFGLLVFNFPKGKLFTGDGGAYLIGFMLSALSILLVHRSFVVSPWLPMLLLLYPLTETLFSIFRRLLIEKTSPFDPDNKHLHSLIYRSIKHQDEKYINNNAKTSVLIWPIMLCTTIPAILFWNDTNALMVATGVFLVLYCAIYMALYHKLESPYSNAQSVLRIFQNSNN